MSSERGATGTETGTDAGDGDGTREHDEPGADGGYVHRPDDRAEGDVAGPSAAPANARGSPGGVGWTLVAVVVLAFLVIPGIIYLRPATPGEMGFGFLSAMLVLPMVPAALLGATAVWSAVRGRED